MNTAAQIAAVAALDLPFDLSPAEINRQFAADGTEITQDTRDPMARASELAQLAMNNVVEMPSADEIARFHAERQVEADRIRAGWQEAHRVRNAKNAAEAAERRQARIDAHNARNAALKIEAQTRLAALKAA